MKKYIIGFLASVLIFSCTMTDEPEQYQLTGKIEGIDAAKVYLKGRTDGAWINKDSAIMKNGTFVMTGKVEAPEMFYINIEGIRRFIPVFVENSDITISGQSDSLQNVEISGSKVMDEYNSYLDAYADISDKYDKLYQEYREAREADNKERMDFIDKEFEELEKEEMEFLKSYITRNSNSYVAPYLIQRNAYKIDLEDLIELDASHDASLANSPYVKANQKRIETLKKVAVGKPAVDFSMTDPDGNEISLSSFKGKYVLVDFWASWCGPCRRENPNVVACYNDFNEKGFEVFGVSFDTDREKWLQAVEDDGLIWAQVSDLEGWGNAAGKLYGVMAIPSNVLINPEGIIIAKELRGDNLREKLEEVLQ